MKPSTEIPDDPALPALEAFRTTGLAGAVPSLGLAGRPVELLLHRYHRGVRAAFEARIGEMRLAVKAYEEDPTPVAALHEALAAELTDGSGLCLPPVLAFDHELRVIVTGWLEGPPAHKLIEHGQGRRAGELAARWFQHSSSLDVKLGPSLDAARMLEHVRKWVTTLAASDPALGRVATALGEMLVRTRPRNGSTRLVHGSFYPRHVLDLGDASGVIDWEQFGQGPAELDAGEFLAATARIGLAYEPHTTEAARATEAFLAATADLLDEQTLTWYRVASLVRLANKRTRRPGDDPALGLPLLNEATRLADAAGMNAKVMR